MSDRQTFVALDQQGIHFVTKRKTNYRAEVIAPYRRIQGRRADRLRFERGQVVHFYGSEQQLLDHRFRLVEAYDEER